MNSLYCAKGRALKNLALETVSRRPHVSGNKCGFVSSAATLTLVILLSLSACVALSAAEFSLSAPVLFKGAVDSSAGADVGDGFFVGATDEPPDGDDGLRLYNVKGGLLVRKLDAGVEGGGEERAWARKD